MVVPVPERIYIPILDAFHACRPEMSHMNNLSRMFVRWPGLDLDVEKKVQHCSTCQASHSSPPPSPLYPWKWPTHPWTRLHLDFAGPFMGHMFLIIINAL